MLSCINRLLQVQISSSSTFSMSPSSPSYCFSPFQFSESVFSRPPLFFFSPLFSWKYSATFRRFHAFLVHLERRYQVEISAAVVCGIDRLISTKLGSDSVDSVGVETITSRNSLGRGRGYWQAHGASSMNQIKQIQAHALHRGADQTSLLLDLILSIPNLPYAGRLLASLTFPPSTFLCNKLLRAYSTSSVNFHLCISLFSSMHRQHHRRPNLHSFTFAISACTTSSSPYTGRALHALLFKFGFLLDAFVFTSLIHMYCKTGYLTFARKLFDEMYQPDIATWNSMITGYAKSGDLANASKLFEKMPVRNVISWTSMISGYSQNEMYEESIEMFMRMWEMGEVRPNEVTLTSILPACANVGAMELGEKIETFARENNLLRNVFVGSALVEMYAKCGDIDRAMMVFREVGEQRNVCSWNSMIMGLAVHGRWKDSLQLFDEMKQRGITPVDITFTGVLMACTHGGLVEEGKRFFRSMENELLISPKIQHYGCMVDLLGRAGHLNEAYNLVKMMPMEPDAAIWGALLGACSFHRNVEFAEIAAEFLFKLEPWNPGNYVILANIYASAGWWECVARVWRLMRGRKQKKEGGYSLIELGGKMHKFLVEDKSHPNFREIYEFLDEIYIMMGLVDVDSGGDFIDYGFN